MLLLKKDPCPGTHLVFSDSHTIVLHELVLKPEPQLRQLVTHPSPCRDMRSHRGAISAAHWADGGGTVFLYVYAGAVDHPMDESSSEDEEDDIHVRVQLCTAFYLVNSSSQANPVCISGRAQQQQA